MSTKTTIQNLINTNLASGSDITAAELRAVLTSILDNLYGSIISETRTTTSAVSRITTPNTINTNITYGIHILKQGRLVTIKGFVWNQSNVIVSNNFVDDFIFEIIDSEYLPDSSSTTTTFPVSSGTFVELNSSENKLYMNQLGAGELRTFNIQYFTQN